MELMESTVGVLILVRINDQATIHICAANSTQILYQTDKLQFWMYYDLSKQKELPDVDISVASMNSTAKYDFGVINFLTETYRHHNFPSKDSPGETTVDSKNGTTIWPSAKSFIVPNSRPTRRQLTVSAANAIQILAVETLIDLDCFYESFQLRAVVIANISCLAMPLAFVLAWNSNTVSKIPSITKKEVVYSFAKEKRAVKAKCAAMRSYRAWNRFQLALVVLSVFCTLTAAMDVTLPVSKGFSILGAVAGDQSGISVSAAGDVYEPACETMW